MTYSKGPLQVVGPSDGKGLYDDGGDYAIVEIVESGCRAIIGEANHRVGENEYRDAEANARLWAAASGMLEALKVAIDALGYDRTRQDRLEAQKIINAAILKAKGERK